MDLKLDPLTGDLQLEDGDLALAKDAEAIEQHLRTRLKTFLGEWFLDQSVGINYFDEVFVKNPQQVVIDAVFKNEILNCPGIIELVSFEADLDGPLRQLSIRFVARHAEGEINFNETLSF